MATQFKQLVKGESDWHKIINDNFAQVANSNKWTSVTDTGFTWMNGAGGMNGDTQGKVWGAWIDLGNGLKVVQITLWNFQVSNLQLAGNSKIVDFLKVPSSLAAPVGHQIEGAGGNNRFPQLTLQLHGDTITADALPSDSTKTYDWLTASWVYITKQ